MTRAVRRAAAVLVAASTLAVAGCRDGGGVGTERPTPVARVAVTPPADTLAPGETAELRAAPTDSAGRPIDAAAVLWSSSDPDVATVDGSGRVRALAPGAALVAAVAGGVRGEARLLVRRAPATLEVVPATLGLGESAVLQPIVRDSTGVVLPLALDLVSRDPGVLGRDTLGFGPPGLLTARAMGTATLAVTVDGRELTARVTVEAPRVAHVGFAFRDLVVPVGGTRPLDVGVFVAGAGASGASEGGRIPTRAVTVEWRSSDSSVVTVDAAGVARAHREGEAVVTAVVAGIAGAVGVRAVALPDAPLRFTQIAAGARQTCALSTGGTAYCWGEVPPYARGALGLAVREEGLYTGSEVWGVASLPLPVRSPVRFARLAEGSSARGGCALTADGQAYCWSTAEGARPTAGPLRFTSLSAASQHACGVTGDGEGFCWGSGSDGQLGTGSQEPFTPGPNLAAAPPRPVAGGLRWATIVAGDAEQLFPYSCGVTVDGALHCWGNRRLAPARVGGERRFRSVTVGGQTCAIAVEGATYCWYGVAPPADLETARVDGGRRFVVAAGGTQEGCGVDAAGTVACWRLRFGVVDRATALVGAPSLRTLVFGSDYAAHACGLDREGVAYCWGTNGMGRLGLPRVDGWSRFPGTARPLRFEGVYALPTRVLGQD